MYTPVVPTIGVFFIKQSFAEELFPFVGEISRGPVNIRAGANTNFEIVAKLAKADEVVVLAQNFEWYKIQLPLTATAFIRADYIKEHSNNIGEVVGDKVNLRCQPKAEASPLGQMRQGDLVKLIEKASDWWKIEPPAAAVAWVHKDFVQLKLSQVPAMLLRKPLTVDIVPDVNQAAKEEAVPVISASPVTVEGMIYPVAKVDVGYTHYQVSVAGKMAYYLRDVPHLEHFNRARVKVEGTVIEDKALNLPVLHIQKISLVL